MSGDPLLARFIGRKPLFNKFLATGIAQSPWSVLGTFVHNAADGRFVHQTSDSITGYYAPPCNHRQSGAAAMGLALGVYPPNIIQ
jgi:hypothetical protein